MAYDSGTVASEICEARELWYRKCARGNRPHNSDGTPRSRVLHHNDLALRSLIHQQIARGRPDPEWRWCGNPTCDRERWVIERPYMCMGFNTKSYLQLPVSDYIKDFAEAVIKKFYPGLEDTKAKHRKYRAIRALMDSPPVRAAFWRFDDYCSMKGFYPLTNRTLQHELTRVRAELEGLVSGGMAKNKIQAVHRYLKPNQIDFEESWTLRELVMQFLVTTEIWRQYGSYNYSDWSFGSNRSTAEFLTAFLLNYWIMYTDECFDMERTGMMTERRWDENWTRWFDEYPVVKDDEDFILRQEREGDEQTVLEEVGYLGGIGTYVPYPVLKAPRRRRNVFRE